MPAAHSFFKPKHALKCRYDDLFAAGAKLKPWRKPVCPRFGDMPTTVKQGRGQIEGATVYLGDAVAQAD